MVGKKKKLKSLKKIKNYLLISHLEFFKKQLY